MDDAFDFELLDAGDGARLERFGDRIVDRPHPAVLAARGDPGAWRQADLVFDRERGWSGTGSRDPWTIAAFGLTLELRATPTGQVGVFPEQAASWLWLRERLTGLASPNVLHLFGYTGAAPLALAAAGARVTVVDASRPAVAWARRNAGLSGASDAPIRWIVDDALAFIAREHRRGRRYDGVVLDPPTYGHGSGGRDWRIENDLAELLAWCARIVDRDRGFTLLTAHTANLGPDRLAGVLAAGLGARDAEIDAGDLTLDARSGPRLELGAFARWSGSR